MINENSILESFVNTDSDKYHLFESIKVQIAPVINMILEKYNIKESVDILKIISLYMENINENVKINETSYDDDNATIYESQKDLNENTEIFEKSSKFIDEELL